MENDQATTPGHRVLNLGADVQSTSLALMGVKNWEAQKRSEPLPYPAVGLIRRQCTSEYKVIMIEQFIRYQVLKLKPRQAAPKDNGVLQLMGLSSDEAGRIIRVKARFQGSRAALLLAAP
jgi:hypothetical protein